MELDVDLSAAGDQVLIAPSGSTIHVSGTNYSTQAFSNVTALVVQGANTSSEDVPDQVVTIGGSGGTMTLDSLTVSGVTSVTFTDVTVNAGSGEIDVSVSEDAPAEETTSALLLQKADAAPHVAVSVTGSTLLADNITLDAKASSSFSTEEALGKNLDALGVAAVIADLEPSATVSVDGSSTITADENVAISADVDATVESSTKVGTDVFGVALNPADAAIALSIVNSSAVTHIGGGSNVSAGAGSLSLTSTNTTEVKTEVNGTGFAGGATAAVTLDNSTSKAFVDGGSTLTADTVDISATTTNTAETRATATTTGGGPNTAVKSVLGGNDDPAYLDEEAPSEPVNPAFRTSPAETAETQSSGGLPLAVAAAVAVSRFTPTTQAYVDSSTVNAATAININASANNSTSTESDGSQGTGDTRYEDARNGVGLGVSISDTIVSNTATVASTTHKASLSAPSILVQAATPSPSGSTPNLLNVSTEALSGSSGTVVAVAGALGLNIVSETSEASIPSGSNVAAVGNLTLNAQDNVTETAKAKPPEGLPGVESGKLGFGASVALNVVDNNTLADLGDAAQLPGPTT
jgi:hypothetical protein